MPARGWFSATVVYVEVLTKRLREGRAHRLHNPEAETRGCTEEPDTSFREIVGWGIRTGKEALLKEKVRWREKGKRGIEKWWRVRE